MTQTGMVVGAYLFLSVLAEQT